MIPVCQKLFSSSAQRKCLSGAMDDDDLTMGANDWYDYCKKMFRKVTKNDLVEFENKYKGKRPRSSIVRSRFSGRFWRREDWFETNLSRSRRWHGPDLRKTSFDLFGRRRPFTLHDWSNDWRQGSASIRRLHQRNQSEAQQTTQKGTWKTTRPSSGDRVQHGPALLSF